MPSVNGFFLHLKRNNDKETDVIAAKVATVDLVVELNLPLSTLVRINKVFRKSLRIQTMLKGQLKMFLFLVLSSSFLCPLFFFFVIRGRHVCVTYSTLGSDGKFLASNPPKCGRSRCTVLYTVLLHMSCTYILSPSF